MTLPSTRTEAERAGEVLVFVYGTLLRGESNHRYLSGARYVCELTTPASYDLFDLGSFPAMVAGGSTAVRGEVWACSRAVLARLDELEEHPEFFRRVPIELEDGLTVDSYLLSGAEASRHPRIASGDWRARPGRDDGGDHSSSRNG